MPEVQEVFRMATQKVRPDPGFEDRQYDYRRKKERNRKIGVYAFVAAMGAVAAVLVLRSVAERQSQPASTPAPTRVGFFGLPPEGAVPSTPESGELVVELRDHIWVYADGRVISRVYLPKLEPYSGLVEQHLAPEGVELLRSNVLSTGLFEHDLDLAREDLQCCLEIRVRDGDRLVRVTWGWRAALSDPQAPKATPEQATALQSLSALLTSPASWPASVWTDQQIRAYVPTSYSFCSRWAEPSRVLALLPEPARDLLGAGYLKTDPRSEDSVDCSRMTTEEARALAGILDAEFGREGGSLLKFSLEDPEVPRRYIRIVLNPVLPHGTGVELAGAG
jgi:hypothetical protein